ncbi:ABC transporter substrate-binding protein [SAR202 cluster bacterium AC-647-N09_OGT_505m]|nr:ABC transporter substrate-binding protein [SAR202 cluster bacterium AC-647-N09_OGT_505m]
MGGTAIGRDAGSTFPSALASLPTVGSAYNPSVEAIVALEPDLILIEAITQGHLSQVLARVNVPVIAVRATSVQDVEDGLTLMGQVIDQEEEAGLAITEIGSRIKAVMDSTTVAQSVLVLISDADRNIYAAKPDSYPGAVVNILGLSNVAEGLPDSGPFPGFTIFSAEQAISSNPDIVLTISPAPAPAPRLSDMLPRVPGFGSLPAVVTGNLYEVSSDLLLSAPGPRIVDAVEEIAGLLNPSSSVY